jgi:mono/diheme cytochrome c family protein/glucose/arabinose dehydrogenase
MKRFSSVMALLFACALAAGLPTLAFADASQDINPPDEIMNRPAPVLSPQEALESFEVAEGFEIQLVADDALVEDPVAMAWDADGRLWVCEMRGYMPDQFGEGEEEPTGKIVILEDTDADGKMDKRTVFLDEIVLPRAIGFAKGGILYADFEKLYYVRINADGSAGFKQTIDPNYSNNGGGKSNVEHQANGLLYGLDNWYYNAKSSRRYAYINGRFRRAATEFRGQWGITQDDNGRLLGNRNPVLIQYELFPPSATLRNDNLQKFNAGEGILTVKPDVYPIHPTPGTNRSYRPAETDHQTWKLKRATAACGPVIYRGHQFPESYYGDVFIPEPAGNLLKRVVIDGGGEGKPSAKHAYENKEFIASTDERSRFVNAYTGPDGCLYLVDMYRGLIQHKTYITNYLRRQINARGLDKPIGHGRIYRVVYKDNPVDNAPPKLSEMEPAQLVELLGHRNAWYRHTAQRLLVQSRADVVPQLEQMATTSTNPQARIHALWTLHGMRKLEAGTLMTAGGSEDQRVRIQVLRLAEDFEGTPQAKVFVALMKTYANQPSWEMDLQLAFSAGVLASLDTPEAYDVLLGVLERRDDSKLFRHAVISGLKGKEAVMLAKVDDGPIKSELTGVMIKSVESGDLTIGALLALIDSPDFADQREQLLGNLASQAVSQDRGDIVEMLVERMAKPGTTVTAQQVILRGFVDGRAMRSNAAELDGKPELFEKWMADPPEKLAELVGQLEEVFVFEKTVVDEALAQRLEAGKMFYAARCSNCHNADGTGLPSVAPPLVGSEWVEMHPKTLAALVLNGVEGDIMVAGKLYTSPADTPGHMPGLKHEIVDDQELADILTFIRSREFNHNASEVAPQTVAEVRSATANRTELYSPAQLEKLNVAYMKQAGMDVPEPPKGPESKLVHAGWLDAVGKGLVITLLAVVAPLVLLLVVTVFGAARPAV